MDRNKPNLMEDPTKNLAELFDQLDKKFFQSKLKKGGVLWEWSEKSASETAGYCYQLYDSVQKTKRCYIVLNKPLLMLRKREDVVDTLLHEMIHALLYIQGIEEKNGGHGPNFCRIMRNINKVAGTKITVYHKFHDEVSHCKDLLDLNKKPVKAAPKPIVIAAPKPIVKATPKLIVKVTPNPIVKATPKPIVKEAKRVQLFKPFLAPGPKSPGVPSPMQTKQYKTLAEIYEMNETKRRVAYDDVKLIGYDSDLSDYDSDSDYEYDRALDDWMDYAKTLKRVAPWIRSISQER